ncbi:MAG TPA: cob(I)yrinic acid a,c-diamide adenosyltransferase [Lachnospiraceae bacterium]|nr:cob(I)yrinic acid a,c-diamide adenosyltransferase [Lachnospiraceae bacterium]
MKIYTGTGDTGRTSLLTGGRVSKTDDRIELLGTIDELNSAIGLAKAASPEELKEALSGKQRLLMKIMSGIADHTASSYKVTKEEVSGIEAEIDSLENSFPRVKDFVLYGGAELSARLDMARAIARRAERRFYKAAQYYEADSQALKYINRLSDYLYVAARFADAVL